VISAAANAELTNLATPRAARWPTCFQAEPPICYRHPGSYPDRTPTGILAATRTELPPVSNDELTRQDRLSKVTSSSAGPTKSCGLVHRRGTTPATSKWLGNHPGNHASGSPLDRGPAPTRGELTLGVATQDNMITALWLRRRSARRNIDRNCGQDGSAASQDRRGSHRHMVGGSSGLLPRVLWTCRRFGQQPVGPSRGQCAAGRPVNDALRPDGLWASSDRRMMPKPVRITVNVPVADLEDKVGEIPRPLDIQDLPISATSRFPRPWARPATRRRSNAISAGQLALGASVAGFSRPYDSRSGSGCGRVQLVIWQWSPIDRSRKRGTGQWRSQTW
jgi:hypothetical protein